MRMKGRHECEQDFELNLASIIDCFTVLIAYLLVSASFISLTAMEVDVAVPGFSSAPSPEDQVELTMDLDAHRNILVKVTGPSAGAFLVPAKSDQWDTLALAEKLASMKASIPGIASVMLTAERSVEYRDVVAVLEAAKPHFPDISLGEHE